MDLQTVFTQLVYGELAQAGLAKTGSIALADYPKIITHINLGVLELHKRFLLREKEVIIQLYEHITLYKLHWDYAYTNSTSTQTYKYIMDSAAYPFNGFKLLKILSACDELGQEIVLNPVHVEAALENETLFIAYTPSQLELQVPFPDSSVSISVICQAAPTDIATNTTSLTTEVDLPEVLLKPLLIFIAERYFMTLSADKNENKIYPNKFEMACAEIENKNLVNTSQIVGDNKFWRNGWV